MANRNERNLLMGTHIAPPGHYGRTPDPLAGEILEADLDSVRCTTQRVGGGL